jgi:hypothetical protein
MSEFLVPQSARGDEGSKGLKRIAIKRRRSAVPVPDRYRNRPSSIRTGIYRIWESSTEMGFTRATTAVLQAILALGVSATNPFRGVYAKKKTLAKTAVVSDTTLYRVLKVLEVDGWIIRAAQPRLEDGSLDLGEIFITTKLALLTGLTAIDDLVTNINGEEITGIAPKFAAKENRLLSTDSLPGAPTISAEFHPKLNTTSIETVDGLVDGPIYKEQYSYPKASVNDQSAAPTFVRIEGRSVPAELLWLITENRLTFGGLFDLMKKAKTVSGQQLSNFVSYRGERIRQLKSKNDCYRYLRSLIQQGIDAKHLCAERSKRNKQDARREQHRSASELRVAWCRAYDGQTFSKPASTATFRVNGPHGLIEVGENGNPSRKQSIRISSRFISAVEEGRLQKFIKPFVQPTMIGSRLSALLLQLKGV